MLDKRQLRAKVPLSFPTIWKQVKAGKFPAPVMIANKCFWYLSEIDEHLLNLKRRTYRRSVGEEPEQERVSMSPVKRLRRRDRDD